MFLHYHEIPALTYIKLRNNIITGKHIKSSCVVVTCMNRICVLELIIYFAKNSKKNHFHC